MKPSLRRTLEAPLQPVSRGFGSAQVGTLFADKAEFTAVRTVFRVGGMNPGDGSGEGFGPGARMRIRTQFGRAWLGVRWFRIGFGSGGGPLRLEAGEAVLVPVEGAVGGVNSTLEVDEFEAGVTEDAAESE